MLNDWPRWMSPLIWTVLTIGVAYLAGHLIRAIVQARVARLAARTGWQWDDALVVATRRVPFWAVLTGAYISLRYWALAPDDYERAVRVISALAVLSVTFALAGIGTRLVATYRPPTTAGGVPVPALMQNVVRGLIVTLGALVVVRSFGWEITPYLTALGVGGLAVALALQDPLSNFFSGVFLSVSGQVRIGDCIRLDSGIEGYVADFNWRATSIRTLGNSLVIVPNARLAQAIVTNFHEPSREIVVPVDVAVHYLSDLTQVEQVTLRVARDVMATVPGGVPGFDPVVRFSAFGGNSVSCTVALRAQEFSDQFLVRHEFIKRLHATFEREGLGMPFSPVDPRSAPKAVK